MARNETNFTSQPKLCNVPISDGSQRERELEFFASGEG